MMINPIYLIFDVRCITLYITLLSLKRKQIAKNNNKENEVEAHAVRVKGL